MAWRVSKGLGEGLRSLKRGKGFGSLGEELGARRGWVKGWAWGRGLLRSGRR